MSKNWPLRFLLLLFLTPVIAALYLQTHGDLLSSNHVQHGTLIEPVPLQFETLFDLNHEAPISAHNKWQLIYVMPEICDIDCQQQKQLLHNLHIALGADRERVIVATTHKNLISPMQQEGSMLIVNPLGLNIMQYAPKTELSGLLKDLKRLLKYSHAK
jgi:hypothetical protein